MDDNDSARLQKAVDGYNSGLFKNMGSAAKAWKVNYGTLRNQIQGNHKSARNAHESQQLLSNAQTAVVIDWCKHKALKGEPYSHRELKRQVFNLTGNKPGQAWVSRFLE
jgi:hypothetical protein